MSRLARPNLVRLGLALAWLVALFACTPAPPSPTPTSTASSTASPIALRNADLPTVLPPFTLRQRDPAPGVPLTLRPTLTFTFTRPLDAASVPAAFRLTDATGETLSGKFTFPAEDTFRFVPDRALQPETRYTVTLTTDLRAADGTALAGPLTFTYTTEAALAVQRVFPAEDSKGVPLDAEISVIFNKPVAPLTSREAATPLPLEITPAVPGHGTWVSSTIFMFHPDHPLLSNATYTVRLPATVIGASGERLAEPIVWRFTTRAVQVTNRRVDSQWASASRPVRYARRDAAVRLTFSDPMDEFSVARALSLTAAEGAPVPPYTLRWNDEATEVTLVPQGLYAPDAIYTVVLSTEARAQDGGHLAAPEVFSFQTAGRPTVVRTLYPKGDYAPWVTLEFNTYLDRATLKGHIRISPAPERLAWNIHGRLLDLGHLEPGTTYTITLLPGIADLYGETLAEPYTFQITTAHLDPNFDLMLPGRDGALLRADAPHTLWVRHANLQSLTVRLFAVSDEQVLDGLRRNASCPTTDTLTLSRTLDLSTAPRDRVQYLTLDLDELLGQPVPPGAYCLRVSGQPHPRGGESSAWLFVVTDHLTLKTYPQGGLVWVTALQDGAPQAGLPVQVFGLEPDEKGGTRLVSLAQGNTDAQGLAQWDHLSSTPRFALLHTATRFAFVNAQWEAHTDSGYFSSYWWIRDAKARRTEAFLYTDRPLYRPGQSIFFKGLVRINEDLHYRLPEITRIWVELTRGGTLVDRQTLSLSPEGTFAGSFELAAEAPVGTYTLKVYTGPQDDPQYLGRFAVRVAAYHKPVFEVHLTPEQADLTPGQSTVAHLQATYYAGDVVAHAQVAWYTEAQAYFFHPPAAFQDYSFTQQAYWPWKGSSAEAYVSSEWQSGEGQTDTRGRLEIPLDLAQLPGDPEDRDVQVNLWATVTDIGGNVVSGHTQVVVRQSEVYVGLKADTWVGVVRQPLSVHLVALNPHGEPLAGQRITVKVLHEEWHSVQRRGADGILRWENSLETVPVTTLSAVATDAQGKTQVTFTPEQSGIYRLVARTTDAQGRPRQAVLRVWVAGKQALLWAQDSHLLPVVPDRAAYQPGETARLLVPRPFAEPTYALVTLERGRVYRAWVVTLDEASNLLQVPLGADLAPQIFASVLTLRPAGEDRPPDYRLGTVRLPVALDEQTLRVEVTPDRRQAGPGETLHLALRTTTLDGRPVPAEVSVAVVDKALLALAPDAYDLLAALYPPRDLQVATALGVDHDLAAYNARLQRLIPTGEGMGGGGEKGSDTGGVITVRETFRDTAFWRAQVHTDEQGRAEVSFTLPDNMTTWVVCARAVTADTRAGEGVAEVRVTRPFFVRLHTPAFFTAGDEVTLQAVVHNTTDAPLQAEVRLRRAEGVTLVDPATQQVTVPAGGQATVLWRAQVPADAQRVDLLVEAQADGYSDASRPTLTLLSGGGIPVYRYHTIEAVGTAGALSQAGQVVETVAVPSTAEQATLHLQLSGSLVAGLQETLLSLGHTTQPDSRCTPSYASALLANAALIQALDALDTPPPAELTEAAQQMVQALVALQTLSGGWGWCGELYSEPAPSAWAAWALLEARQAGLTVDDKTLANAARYLAGVASQARPAPNTLVDNDVLALTIDVLARLEGHPTGAAYRLAQVAGQHDAALSLGGWALLLHAAQKMGMEAAFTRPIVQRLENEAVLASAIGAHWDGGYGWWGWRSTAGTTALALRALLATDPQAPFLPQVVMWLARQRNEQGWGSDTTNALVALALSRWVALSGETHPDYDYAAYVDDVPLTPQQHMGPQEITRPLSWTWSLQPAASRRLRVARGPGEGMLYYQAFLDLTLPAGQLPPLSAGISLTRAYYAVSDLKTPRATFRTGDLVQVRLTLVVPHDVHQVVLTDYLPAGFEALDPTQEFSPAERFSYQDYLRYGWGGWYFYHRERYDDRVVMVAPTLPAGVYTLTYYARATVPGRFQVRPTVAYDTFFPDVRGRSAGAVVDVRR